jgi:hypothetical protein
LKDKDRFRSSLTPGYSRNRITHLIESFESILLLEKKEKMEWRKIMKMEMTELYLLEKVVISLPVIQVSVERSLSGLVKFVLSPYCNNFESSL